MTQAEHEKLCRLVEQWNENRLDLFHLSYPTKDLEIQGVMRFYFQESGDRVLTKCIRVSSTATTDAVIEALVEKFLPDLKMLSDPEYSLWEVHENGEERQLDPNEKPLLVQLNWHTDDREGRFLLKKHGVQFIPITALQQYDTNSNIKRSVKRFSKREKRELKKKHRDIVTVNGGREEEPRVSDLYKAVPPTTFTRTISNPEIVMKKRREKKLEARLKEMGHGGSLKIYGGDVEPSRPYVTLLVSIRERADALLREALSKYNIPDTELSQFQLVEVSVAGGEEQRRSLTDLREVAALSRERVLHGDECPLMELASRPDSHTDVFYALRRRTSPTSVRLEGDKNRSKLGEAMRDTQKAAGRGGQGGGAAGARPSLLSRGGQGGRAAGARPSLLSLLDEAEIPIAEGVTEVGSDDSLRDYAEQHVRLPGLLGRHCVMTFMEGTVTVTPSSPSARIEVNQERITQTVILNEDDIIQLGDMHIFRLQYGRRSRGESASHQTYSGARSAMPPSVEAPYQNRLTTQQQSRTAVMEEQSFLNGSVNHPTAGQGNVPPAPLSIQVAHYRVWDFLLEVMSRSAESASFPLSAAYSLYLAVRCFSQQDKPFLAQFIARVANQLTHIAQEPSPSVERLLLWLANSSELAHLLSCDASLPPSLVTPLRSSLQALFHSLCRLAKTALEREIPDLLNEHTDDEHAIKGLLSLLDTILRLSRSCRLNPALTIQLSSQLFSSLNARLFNGLLDGRSLSMKLGRALTARLAKVHSWAERVGVELASECLLDRVRQAALLLQAPRDDLAAMGATAYKLNSLQMQYLLTYLECTTEESPLRADVVQRMVGLSERQADETAVEEGEKLTLEESDSLAMPFVIPQEGYAADESHSVHPGLIQFLESLKEKGVCSSVTIEAETHEWVPKHNSYRGSSQHDNSMQVESSSNSSTTMRASSVNGEGRIVRVHIQRGKTGIGLSIVAAQGVGDHHIGIYVKKVIEESVAAKDGRLQAGDQLLSVNGITLSNLSQEQAAQCMSAAGPEVRFEVLKGAASTNGLAAYLHAENSSNGETEQSDSRNRSTDIRPLPVNQRSVPAANSTHYSSVKVPITHLPSTSSHSLAAQPPLVSNMYAPPAPHQNSPQSSEYERYPAAPIAPRMTTSMDSTYASITKEDLNPRFGQSAQSSVCFAQPPARHYKSNSASDLQYDPNTSFSGRSIASSSAGGFSQLPHYYRRPTVVQPGRTCPSPGGLRHGAASPTPLRQGAVSPTPLRSGAASPSWLSTSRPPSANALRSRPPHPVPQESHRPTTTDLISSPPLARSSPAPHPPTLTTFPVPTGTSNPCPHQYNSTGVSNSERQSTTFDVLHGGVPTAFVQALGREIRSGSSAPSAVNLHSQQPVQVQPTNQATPPTVIRRPQSHPDYDLESRVRQVEREGRITTMIADDEMYPDMRHTRMSEEETRRSRTHRTETVIDDLLERPVTTFGENPPYDRRNLKEIEDDVDSPSIVGAQEVYRDPRARKLTEMQHGAGGRTAAGGPSPHQSDGAGLAFGDKMRLFAHCIGEQTPKNRMKESSAQRHIEQEE